MASTTHSRDSSVNLPTGPQQSPHRNGSPITFGVEIESVLAFDQRHLQNVLNRYYGGSPVIVKAFPDSAHDCFLNENDQAYRCRNLYPSWILEVPTETDPNSSLALVGQHTTTITGRAGRAVRVRRYLAEPLIIAKEAIKAAGVPVDVKAQLVRNADTILLGNSPPTNCVVLRTKSTDYQRWTLTTDYTLIGSLRSQLYEALGDKVFQQTIVTDPDGSSRNVIEKAWDSSGFELISPVFKYTEKSSAFTSITKSLEALATGSSYKAIPSVWASLQVHVGLDCQHPRDIPLLTLQHLAYILVCHEDLLSALHPRSRCGLKLKPTATEIDTEETPVDVDDDYEEFDPDAPLPPEPTPTPAEKAAEDERYLQENDERVSNAERQYTGYNTTNSNARYFCQTTSSSYPPTKEHVASHIFQPDITIPQLVALLQKPSTNPHDAAQGHRYRGYMYNFDNILTMFLEDQNAWKTGKPTIEFRQHACSIDPAEIKKWVEVCFGIVKLAQRMAEQDFGGIANQEMYSRQEMEGSKYEVHGQWPCEDIASLLGENWIGIEEDDRQYWVDRYESYKGDRPSAEEIDDQAI